MLLLPLVVPAADVSRLADRGKVPLPRGESWELIPVDRHGMALVETPAGDGLWSLSGLDLGLERRWSVEWTLRRDRERRDGQVDGDQVSLRFHARRDEEFTLVRIDADDGRLAATELRSPVTIRNTGAVIPTGDDAWVLANTRRGATDPRFGAQGTVLHAHLGTGRVETAGVEAAERAAGDVSLQRVVTDPVTGRPDGVAVTTEGRRRTLHLVGRAPTGVGRPLVVAPDDTRTLPGGQRARLTDESALVLGLYDDRPNGLAAQGTFEAGYRDGREGFRRHPSFTRFTHVFDFPPEAARERVEARMEREPDAGWDLNLGDLVPAHDLVERGDQLVVIGEAGYPEYQTRTRTLTTTVNGGTATSLHNYPVFAGYRYTHAGVAGFSRQGERRWDPSIDPGKKADGGGRVLAVGTMTPGGE